MMKITVIAVGKLKEPYWQQATKEYLKRLTRYGKVNVTEIEEEKLPEDASDAQIVQALEREAQKILAKTPASSYHIALCIEGRQMNSVAFSSCLQDIAIYKNSEVTFMVGGSYGLADTIKKKADLLLSFSPMTFPHHMARAMLLEQLYRALGLQNGTKYHK